jgi:hypothetical protein
MLLVLFVDSIRWIGRRDNTTGVVDSVSRGEGVVGGGKDSKRAQTK